ncbi:MAG: SDR family oxidoreductase [Acidimicrobiia bacterium]
MTSKRVLVTGGAGYIGSVLTETLLDRGYQVRVLDRFFFGATLDHLRHRSDLELVKGDVRWVDPAIMEGVDAVFDLAAISNDPAGELDPEKTMAINHQGRARICDMAKSAGVRNYVLASSCSIYGFQDGVMDETSPPNPLTTYAEANLAAENHCLAKSAEEFVVTVLRQATVYGLSPRMRFDLAVNGMTLGMFANGVIPVLRDGTQWRPIVHIKDTSQAFITALEADIGSVNGEIFNVGTDEQNFQVLDLAEQVAEGIGAPFDYEWYGEPDHRSYRVSFGKIKDQLGYKTEYTPTIAAQEIVKALRDGLVVTGPRTKTVDWYRSLLLWNDILKEVVIDDVVL